MSNFDYNTPFLTTMEKFNKLSSKQVKLHLIVTGVNYLCFVNYGGEDALVSVNKYDFISDSKEYQDYGESWFCIEMV